ncbi:MAG: hypothetical protein JWQ97_984 [Phenylobacterium sp.]|nr:hypothetical protein [Phenylobacterium sp.]
MPRTVAQIERARRKQAKRDLRQLEAAYGPIAERVDCGECGKPAGLVDGRLVYPHRPDLHAKHFWRCCACLAFVGCHQGTSIPLGTPAGPETQAARRAAHGAFDPLWERKIRKEGVSKKHARGAAYRWLAEQLGIEPAKTHIGMMDAATARRVIEVCAPYQQRSAA